MQGPAQRRQGIGKRRVLTQRAARRIRELESRGDAPPQDLRESPPHAVILEDS